MKGGGVPPKGSKTVKKGPILRKGGQNLPLLGVQMLKKGVQNGSKIDCLEHVRELAMGFQKGVPKKHSLLHVKI
jgi:hypothetical protein